jgi:hypothetical protein
VKGDTAAMEAATMEAAAVKTATAVEATATAAMETAAATAPTTSAMATAAAKPNFGRKPARRVFCRRRHSGTGERHRLGALLGRC